MGHSSLCMYDVSAFAALYFIVWHDSWKLVDKLRHRLSQAHSQQSHSTQMQLSHVNPTQYLLFGCEVTRHCLPSVNAFASVVRCEL